LRLLFLLWVSDFPLYADPRSYHDVAVCLLEGKFFIPMQPPGQSLYLLLFYVFFNSDVFIGRLSTIVLYVIFSLLLFFCVRRVASQVFANILLLIFAVYPLYIICSVEPTNYLMTAILLLAIVYLLFIILEKESIPLSILLGLVLGVVALTRPSTLILLLVVPAYLMVKRKVWWVVVIVLLVSLLVISLWVLEVYRLTGHFVVINHVNSLNFFLGNNPHTPLYKTWFYGSYTTLEGSSTGFKEILREIKMLPVQERDGEYIRQALSHIIERPQLFLIRTFSRVQTYFAFDSSSAPLLYRYYGADLRIGLLTNFIDAFIYLSITSLSLVAIFIEWSRRRKEFIFIILVVLLSYALPYFISLSHPVYHFPVVPLLAIIAVLALNEMKGDDCGIKLRERKSKSFRIFVISLIIFIVIQIVWGISIVINFSRFLG